MQRQHRLKKSAEFQRVRALRRSWAHPLLVLYVSASSPGGPRVGISVSKRIGKAVARNRAKRLIREAVRVFLPGLPEGQDLVFVARPSMGEASYRQVVEAVERLLRRAGLLHGTGLQRSHESTAHGLRQGRAPSNTDESGDRQEAEPNRQ